MQNIEGEGACFVLRGKLADVQLEQSCRSLKRQWRNKGQRVVRQVSAGVHCREKREVAVESCEFTAIDEERSMRK